MPNSELKQDAVTKAFRVLNSQQSGKERGGVAKSNVAIKVPNQNQWLSKIENQTSQKQSQNLLHGFSKLEPKVKPKSESWIRTPSKMVALNQKMENWIQKAAPQKNKSSSSEESKNWVRHLEVYVNVLRGGDIANSPSAEWVRFPSVSSNQLAISTPTQIDQS